MSVVVMGVSGCGKSTVGAAVAAAMGWPFLDGDDVHPPGNKAKMAAGVALSDEDRVPWLAAVRGQLDLWAGAGSSGVVACSALKRAYREVLRAGPGGMRFVFLDVPEVVLEARLAVRTGHFFSARLLDTQLAELERPEGEEDVLVVRVSVGEQPEDVVHAVLTGLGR